MRRGRAPAAVLVAALAAVVTAVSGTPAAATTYRYWVYWHAVSGSWQYSQIGPGSSKLADGAVDGWRFGRGAASSSAMSPRSSRDIDTLCGSGYAAATGYQVAVVVDYGTEPDNPGYPTKAYCLSFDSQPTGAKALVATRLAIRSDGSGLICALHDYPKPPECGKTAVDPAPTASPSRTRTPVPKPTAPAATSAPVPRPAASAGRPSASARAIASSTVPVPPTPTATSTSPDAPPVVEAGGPEPEPLHNSGVPTSLLAGVGLIAALGAAAAVRARR